MRSPSLRPDRKTFPVGFVAGGALALAATLALVTGRGPTLPAYEVAVSGNVAATRGEPAPHEEATVRVTPQGTIDLVARPAQDVSGPLTAVAFLGSYPIGGPITGLVGDWVGLEWSLGYGAIVSLVAVAGLIWWALGRRPEESRYQVLRTLLGAPTTIAPSTSERP